MIDVSNVCYSHELPPRTHGPVSPLIDRLTLVVAAWRERYGRRASIRCVADASVRCEIGDRRWRPVARDLSIEVTSYADELILDHARDERRFVLSRDQFVEHRRGYPWIEARPERFLRWRYERREILFVPSGIRPQPHQVVSERVEANQLRREGLDPDRDRALLETRWRCETSSCLRAHFWQQMLLSWPAKDAAGRARCPACRSPLVPLGPRGVFREVLVFAIDGATPLTRFPVEHGVSVVVGRGRRDQGISLDAIPGAPKGVGRLSRQHALLRLDERGQLRVVDLGSTNGTVVRTSNGAPSARLARDKPAVVGLGGGVELAGVLRLELSGKRFLSTLPPAPRGSSDNLGTELSRVDPGIR